MLGVQGEALPFAVHYTTDGVNTTGLTVTVDIYRLAKADAGSTHLVSDGACTEVAVGLYRYLLASGSNNADGILLATFYTATDTVDAQNIATVWVVGYGNLSSIATILTDTGTDGVVLATDAVSAAALKADAVTEIQSGLATPATVWTNASRTLTQSAADVIDAVTGTAITKTRGNSWDFEITGVTLDANKQQLIIKRSRDDPDSAALLMIDSDDGLIILNGSTDVTAGDASLSYAGTTLTPVVKTAITAQLPDGTFIYNIQYVTAAAVVKEPYGGTFVITADGVRATE